MKTVEQINHIHVPGSSLTVIYKGDSRSIDYSHAAFAKAEQFLKEDKTEDLLNLLDLNRGITRFTDGDFSIVDDEFRYKGKPAPKALSTRVVQLFEQGFKYDHLMKFLERLSKNPSERSTEQLYAFLEHDHLPITPDGYFLAYKGLRDDFKDCHSGKFDNSPGQKHSVKRSEVDDNPNVGCSYGFHVGSLSYANGFAQGKLVIVKVDPADVVAVPYDSNCQKVRTCAYEVLCEYTGELNGPVRNNDASEYKEPDLKEEEEDEDEEVQDEFVKKVMDYLEARSGQEATLKQIQSRFKNDKLTTKEIYERIKEDITVEVEEGAFSKSIAIL